MAKSQKKSNREARKPKQPKAAAALASRSFLETAQRTWPSGPSKRTGR